MKIIKIQSNHFKINRKTGRITFTIIAHNRIFVGIAKCNEKDEYDEVKGMRMAKLRAYIAYRTFEAALMKQFIEDLKIAQHNCMNEYDAVSKMYMTTIQSAAKQLKKQYERIRTAKHKLEYELIEQSQR